MAAAHTDPETALDTLIEAGAVDESDSGELTVTDDFQKVLALYHDIYGAVSNEEFYSTVGDIFNMPPDEAEVEVDKRGITREDVIAYLAAKSFLDIPVEQELLSVMASIIVELEPASSVPEGLFELRDSTFESFLEVNDEVVVTVWKRFCEPCDAMKAELDEIQARIPSAVAVAGVDGEAADDFCRTFDITSAPTVACFRDGTLVEKQSGLMSPDEVEEFVARVF
ncbi:thioredoxin family protein [Haloferax namakaokahaiae]|uniref:Thioredoxin family protein n=1 Tax=Haloferax namakaokahaiae TaxID=1748331 RepID=A0ABD5ZG97_9EURY